MDSFLSFLFLKSNAKSILQLNCGRQVRQSDILLACTFSRSPSIGEDEGLLLTSEKLARWLNCWLDALHEGSYFVSEMRLLVKSDLLMINFTFTSTRDEHSCEHIQEHCFRMWGKDAIEHHCIWRGASEEENFVVYAMLMTKHSCLMNSSKTVSEWRERSIGDEDSDCYERNIRWFYYWVGEDRANGIILSMKRQSFFYANRLEGIERFWSEKSKQVRQKFPQRGRCKAIVLGGSGVLYCPFFIG